MNASLDHLSPLAYGLQLANSCFECPCNLVGFDGKAGERALSARGNQAAVAETIIESGKKLRLAPIRYLFGGEERQEAFA